MKRNLLFVLLLAAVCASAASTSAMAWNTRDTGLVIGGMVLGQAMRPYYPPQQLPGGYNQQQVTVLSPYVDTKCGVRLLRNGPTVCKFEDQWMPNSDGTTTYLGRTYYLAPRY